MDWVGGVNVVVVAARVAVVVVIGVDEWGGIL